MRAQRISNSARRDSGARRRARPGAAPKRCLPILGRMAQVYHGLAAQI